MTVYLCGLRAAKPTASSSVETLMGREGAGCAQRHTPGQRQGQDGGLGPEDLMEGSVLPSTQGLFLESAYPALPTRASLLVRRGHARRRLDFSLKPVSRS